MKIQSNFHFATLCLISIATVTTSSAQTKKIPYSTVAGLIKSQCAYCHNAKSHPEKVDLSSLTALRKSGEHGPIVVAGHPEKSKLIQYIDGTKSPRMPFKKPAMSTTDINLLKKWIAAGAKG